MQWDDPSEEKMALRFLRRVTRIAPFVRNYLRASQALAHAERRRAPGTVFARFGRRLGMRLLRREIGLAVPYLLTPVSITRYFEFDFAFDNIPRGARHCLDLSSPRLLSLFVASRRPTVSIDMLNPDRVDAANTRAIAEQMGYSNLTVSSETVSELAGRTARYDCIWSVSVVEHIAGDDGDTEAMRLLYAALRPGGRLIVTVPVDRRFWLEYRDQDYYGLHGGPPKSGKYFFQRLYDEENIRARLIEPLGHEPAKIAWFGERVGGRFYAYEQVWMANGPEHTIDDPRRIADEYDRFESWRSMPGFGVCGLVMDKPPTLLERSSP
jgi:hypothetical protein